MTLPVYQDLNAIGRPPAGGTLLTAWGDYVTDDIAFLFGEVAWTAPAFTNGWGNAAGLNADPVGFKLVGNTLKLRGIIAGGTVNQAAFVLPAGYRPTGTKFYGVDSNAAHGRITIGGPTAVAPGAVTLITGSNVYATLDGITFDIV